MTRYAEFCAGPPARAHANTGSAAAIPGYLGNSDCLRDGARLVERAYARQSVRDHEALVEAIESQRARRSPMSCNRSREPK
jgi:hypothetical protein